MRCVQLHSQIRVRQLSLMRVRESTRIQQFLSHLSSTVLKPCLNNAVFVYYSLINCLTATFQFSSKNLNDNVWSIIIYFLLYIIILFFIYLSCVEFIYIILYYVMYNTILILYYVIILYKRFPESYFIITIFVNTILIYKSQRYHIKDDIIREKFSFIKIYVPA